MKITQVKLGRISTPLRVPFKTALRTVSSVEDVIVELHTDTGAVGYGEAPPTGVITGDTTGAIIGAIRDHIAPAILGRGLDEFEDLTAAVQKALVHNTSAKAAVDMALWDLLGQKYSAPVYRMLGGARSNIVTDITISVNPPEEMARDARTAIQRGYDCLKVKVGIDPELDFSHLNEIRKVYEKVTKMQIGERQPYVGELVFTAFSGSHQDAINKGMQYMEKSHSDKWEVPYLPIDPADVGRDYEPIIRINSQSGKGGTAFIMAHNFGFELPKAMHPEFSDIVQAETDRIGHELKPEAILELFKREYLQINDPYRLINRNFQETHQDDTSAVSFSGTLCCEGKRTIPISGQGNGPIDAFFNAVHGQDLDRYTFVDYKEHAINTGSDSQAVAYIHLRIPDGTDVFGVGMDHNISMASIKGVLSAINRAKKLEAKKGA